MADPIRQQLSQQPNYHFAKTNLPSDPELAKLTAQQQTDRLNQQQANTQFNAAQAKLMEDRAALMHKKPIDIEDLKRQFAQGGVYNNQMNFRASELGKDYDLAIKQGTREIDLGQELNRIQNKQQQYNADLQHMTYTAKANAEKLGVGDLSQGEILSAYKLGLIGKDAFDAGLAAQGLGSKEAGILSQLYDKQQAASAPGLDLPGSVYSGEGVPADQVALAKKFGEQYGVDPNVLLAIAYHETQFGRLGAGRQGYTLGYGATDSGQISKYAGVVNQYQAAAAHLAARGVHTIDDLVAYHRRVGNNVYSATGTNGDPWEWTNGVVAAYRGITSGQIKAPSGGKGYAFANPSYNYYDTTDKKWVPISVARGGQIQDKDRFRAGALYKAYLTLAKRYAKAHPEDGTAADLIHFVFVSTANDFKAEGNKNPSSAANHTVGQNGHILSLVMYDMANGYA